MNIFSQLKKALSNITNKRNEKMAINSSQKSKPVNTQRMKARRQVTKELSAVKIKPTISEPPTIKQPTIIEQSTTSEEPIAYFNNLPVNLQDEYMEIAKNVNTLYKELKENEIYSTARIDLESTGGRIDLFSQLSEGDFKRELTRAYVFLGDPGSTLEGAIVQNAELGGAKYKNQFGEEYRAEFGVAFNALIINEELAKSAFSAYRSLEESYQGIVGRAVGGYDSETLIEELYDMVVQAHDEGVPIPDRNKKNYKDLLRDRAVAEGTSVLESLRRLRTDEYQRQFARFKGVTRI